MIDQIVVNAACCSDPRYLCDRCRAESSRRLETGKPEALPVVVNFDFDAGQGKLVQNGMLPTDAVLLEPGEMSDDGLTLNADVRPPDPLPILNVSY